MSFIQDAIREWAWSYGAEHPGQAWLLSDRDSWERNPHYTGPDVPHPEYCHDEDEERADVLAALDRAVDCAVASWVPANGTADDIPF